MVGFGRQNCLRSELIPDKMFRILGLCLLVIFRLFITGIRLRGVPKPGSLTVVVMFTFCLFEFATRKIMIQALQGQPLVARKRSNLVYNELRGVGSSFRCPPSLAPFVLVHSHRVRVQENVLVPACFLFILHHIDKPRIVVSQPSQIILSIRSV